MIKLTINDRTYYINVNLNTVFEVQNLNDDDGEYQLLIIHDINFDSRHTLGFQDAINILEGLTLRIQAISPIAQIPQSINKFQ